MRIVRELSEREGTAEAEPAAARSAAVTTLPMLAAGRPVGLLSLVNTEARRFTAADRTLAEELAARTGAAVEHIRLYAERSPIARTLQAGLLSRRAPRHAALGDPEPLPAGGGRREPGRRRLLRRHPGPRRLARRRRRRDRARRRRRSPHRARAPHPARHRQVLDEPLHAIGRLNDELVERATTSLCSVGAAHLRERDGHVHVDVVCAGHPPALLVEGGEVRTLGHHGPLLGAVPSPRSERVRADIPAGAVLVLYTDGVLDATRRDRDRFGERRLARTLTGAEDAITRVDRALREFQVGPQADDTAVLALERLPAEVALPSRPV